MSQVVISDQVTSGQYQSHQVSISHIRSGQDHSGSPLNGHHCKGVFFLLPGETGAFHVKGRYRESDESKGTGNNKEKKKEICSPPPENDGNLMAPRP